MSEDILTKIAQDPRNDEREFIYDDFISAKKDVEEEEIEEIEDIIEDEENVEKEGISEEDEVVESVAKEVLSFDNSIIDRNEEDRDVKEYQKTGDLKILDKIYRRRKPTLQAWAAKHFYPGLHFSEHDMMSDLSIVLINAVEKYDPERKVAFNTCLYTFLLNRIKYMKNSTHAKKRSSDEYEGPKSGMVLSLDYSYNDKEGADTTLKDILPGNEPDGYQVNSFDDMINNLSSGNEDIKDFLLRISNGETISSILEESKTLTYEIKIDSEIKSTLSSELNAKSVKKIMKMKYPDIGLFNIVEYNIESGKLIVKASFKKTKRSVILSKAIRNFKKNKDQYLAGILS